MAVSTAVSVSVFLSEDPFGLLESIDDDPGRIRAIVLEKLDDFPDGTFRSLFGPDDEAKVIDGRNDEPGIGNGEERSR